MPQFFLLPYLAQREEKRRHQHEETLWIIVQIVSLLLLLVSFPYAGYMNTTSPLSSVYPPQSLICTTAMPEQFTYRTKLTTAPAPHTFKNKLTRKLQSEIKQSIAWRAVFNSYRDRRTSWSLLCLHSPIRREGYQRYRDPFPPYPDLTQNWQTSRRNPKEHSYSFQCHTV